MKLVLAVLCISVLSIGAVFPLQPPAALSGPLAIQLGGDGPLFPSLEEIKDYYRHMTPVQRAWTVVYAVSAVIGWGALLMYGLFRVLHLAGKPVMARIESRRVWLLCTGAVLVVSSVVRATVAQVYLGGDWLASGVIMLVGCLVLRAGLRLKRKTASTVPAAAGVET